jgi:hypothetical protein
VGMQVAPPGGNIGMQVRDAVDDRQWSLLKANGARRAAFRLSRNPISGCTGDTVAKAAREASHSGKPPIDRAGGRPYTAREARKGRANPAASGPSRPSAG